MTGSSLPATLTGDTIVALATAPGRSAIAVVRLSGPEAQRIAGIHVSTWPIEPRVATLCDIRGRNGEPLEQALVTLFVAPSSYTGEDVIEISTHGGDLTPALVIEQLVAS